MTRGLGGNVLGGVTLSAARLITGIVRTKVVALLLGASGVGAFSLVLQAYLVGVTLVSMSMAVPIINLGRAHVVRGAFGVPGKLAGTVLTIVLLNGALLFGAVALGQGIAGHDAIADWVKSPGLPLEWVVVAIVVMSTATTLGEGLAFLSDRFDLYVGAGIIGAVGDAVVIILATVMFGLHGAVAALPLSAGSLLLAYAVLLSRDRIARATMAEIKPSLAHVPQIVGYSALLIATIAAMNVSQLVLRALVLRIDSASANGNLQVATSFAAYILSFITTGFWGHLHARAAADGDTPAVRQEFRRILEAGALLAFAGCAGTMVVAPIAVPLLFSHQFASAPALVALYLAGDYAFQVVSLCLGYVLATRRRRRYAALNLLYVLPLLVIGVPAIARWGAPGYAAAHSVSATAALGVVMALAIRNGELAARTAARIGVGGIVVAAAGLALFVLRTNGLPELIVDIPLLAVAMAVGGMTLHRVIRARRAPQRDDVGRDAA